MKVEVCVVLLCVFVVPIRTACWDDDRFQCNSNNRCVEDSHVCDGYKDCEDGSDELECEECKQGGLFCDGKCVGNSSRCDGKQDCKDASDEKNCPVCRGGAFLCDGVCWPNVVRCDGVPWCRDQADERDCPSVRRTNPWCSANRCDGEPTCAGKLGWANGSDEVGCKPEDCNGGALFCDGVCKKASDVCNGYPDCSDGQDELNCNGTCKDGAFLCDDNYCVKLDYVCDGVKWCKDGRDEANCPNGGTNPVTCSAGARCNGIRDTDCAYKDDEFGCYLEMCQEPASKEIFCDGCLLESKICDGIVDCVDGRDEKNCDYTTEMTTTDEPPASTPIDAPTEAPEEKVDTVTLVTYLSSMLYFNTGVLSLILVVVLLASCILIRKSRRQDDSEPILPPLGHAYNDHHTRAYS